MMLDQPICLLTADSDAGDALAGPIARTAQAGPGFGHADSILADDSTTLRISAPPVAPLAMPKQVLEHSYHPMQGLLRIFAGRASGAGR